MEATELVAFLQKISNCGILVYDRGGETRIRKFRTDADVRNDFGDDQAALSFTTLDDAYEYLKKYIEWSYAEAATVSTVEKQEEMSLEAIFSYDIGLGVFTESFEINTVFHGSTVDLIAHAQSIAEEKARDYFKKQHPELKYDEIERKDIKIRPCQLKTLLST